MRIMLMGNSLLMLVIVYVIGVVVPSANAQQVMTVESTIAGHQEQPKILMIVPWQKPKDAAKIESNNDSRERNTFLQPIERRSFLGKTQTLNGLVRDAPSD